MKAPFVLPAVILTTACATVGVKVDQTVLDGLQVGITTKQECLDRLGAPRATSVNSDGTSALIWSYAHANAFGVADSQSIHLIFDEKGILKNKTFSTTDTRRK
jgi:hypothetical protein